MAFLIPSRSLELLGSLLLVGCGPGSGNGGSGSAGGTGTDSAGSGSSTAASATSGSTTSASSGTTMLPSTGPDSSTGAGSTGGTTCPPELQSDLPGVSLDLSTDKCIYTLAEAQAGVETQFNLAIEQALADVDSGDACHETPAGSLYLFWTVTGDGHQHCVCDVGLCPPYQPMPTTLVPGETPGSFTWNAYDWSGPSDTNEPFGEPFPPGDYVVTLRAMGTYQGQAFLVEAKQPVTLVP